MSTEIVNRRLGVNGLAFKLYNLEEDPGLDKAESDVLSPCTEDIVSCLAVRGKVS